MIKWLPHPTPWKKSQFSRGFDGQNPHPGAILTHASQSDPINQKVWVHFSWCGISLRTNCTWFQRLKVAIETAWTPKVCFLARKTPKLPQGGGGFDGQNHFFFWWGGVGQSFDHHINKKVQSNRNCSEKFNSTAKYFLNTPKPTWKCNPSWRLKICLKYLVLS